VRLALSETAILETYGAVVSLPEADEQHIHRDGPPLFDSAISPLLPSHALTFALPLVEMNDEHGSTAFWPGSHRWRTLNEAAPSEVPVVPVGSCLLWDFRLFHRGTPNRSKRYRPFVYATYARRWYQDPVNFESDTRQRLNFDGDFLQGVPESARCLFAHVRRLS
jgi:ectoine hydroxylase-related dioxygenase (phytanoyl-CoA dioxygenase family)